MAIEAEGSGEGWGRFAAMIDSRIYPIESIKRLF
jgi:hypothetical protein